MSQQHGFNPSKGEARRRLARIARRRTRQATPTVRGFAGGKRQALSEWISALAFAVMSPLRPAPAPRCDYAHTITRNGRTVVYDPCQGRLKKVASATAEGQRWRCAACGRGWQQIGRTSTLELVEGV